MEESIFEPMKSLISGYSIGKRKRMSERSLMIERLLNRLNSDRKGTKYPPLKASGLAYKLSHVKTRDLYHLWSICQQAKHFSACFWWSIKAPVDKPIVGED